MKMPGRYGSDADGKAKHGFNGMLMDDEMYSQEGNSYDFGARMYDSRIGRFSSLDPKIDNFPYWSPYHSAANSPIRCIDVNGEWPGITFFFFEFDVGGGLAYGLNYVDEIGVAYDDVGTTHYRITSTLYITNQEMGEQESPDLLLGAGISLTANMRQNWSSDTYYELVASTTIPIPNGIKGVKEDAANVRNKVLGKKVKTKSKAKVGGIVSVNLGISTSDFTIGGGLGAGIKFNYINSSVQESISITDPEKEKISNIKGASTNTWYLGDKQRVLDEDGNVTGLQANLQVKNNKGEKINTGITVRTGGYVYDGKLVTSDVWMSKSYLEKAEKIADEK